MYLLLITLIVLIIVLALRNSRSYFDNSEYQYSNPDLGKENRYYGCVVKECDGNLNDYFCLEKCRIKTYKGDTRDTKDYMCSGLSQDDYYKCMGSLYSDYREL